jgi:iron-sulfur cluster repair protein YtfE (RIC family)
MDALDELEQMHQEARAAFEKIVSGAPDDRGPSWAKLKAELKLHEQIEERFVYDPVVEHHADEDTRISRYHEQHETEASQANAMIDGLSSLEPTGDAWLTQIQELQATMERHMQQEEQEFWPLIREIWGEDDLQRAGISVAAAKAAGKAGATVAEALDRAGQAAGR